MKAIIAMLLIGIFGCHRVPIETKLQTRANSWVGKTELELFQGWGAPVSTTEMGGLKILTYENSKIHAESYRVFGRVKTELKCKVYFSVEPKSFIVKSGNWEGDVRLCRDYIKQAPNSPASDIAVE